MRYSAAMVSIAGTLKGLENISQGRNLKMKPFVTAGVTQSKPAGNPTGTFVTDPNFDGGVDVKYSLTPSLTLDATYRTDFAQVEVDQQQTNLTRFSLFLPEKRDSILENSGTFAFGGGNNSNLLPFFSRRIGLSETGTPIPILGGARVSGQISRYDVGFLAMKTESQDSRPSNNFFAGRVKRKILTNSWFGAVATSRDSSTAADYNRVYGADIHLQFRNLYFDNYLLQSKTPGAAGHDQARRFATAWRGDEVILSAEYNTIQPNFRPDVGFVRRQDITQYSAEASWNPYIRSSNTIRNLRFGTFADYFEGAGSGEVQTRTQRANMGIQFQNNGSINFEIEQTFDRLVREDRIVGIRIPAGDYRYLAYSASANRNRSAKISGNIGFDWGEFWNGNRQSFRGGFLLKPSYRWNAELTYSHDQVKLLSGHNTTSLVGSRFVYAFSARAFVNGFVQYNTATHQVSSNIRFNFTHHPLSDLFLVYNDVRDSRTGEPLQRAIIVKLTNLFNF